MSRDKSGNGGDYEVGYRKPPKAHQFVPGQSGFKGRRKKPDESKAEIVARVRDQVVTVGGRTMTMFELSLNSVMSQTMKTGKPKDLKVLFELLDKYGAIPDHDRAAEAKAGAEEAMRKIFQSLDRHFEIDTDARDAIEKLEAEEAELLLRCPHCGPSLRKRWRDLGYRDLARRYAQTGLHKLVQSTRELRRKSKRGS